MYKNKVPKQQQKTREWRERKKHYMNKNKQSKEKMREFKAADTNLREN